jgi:uncharacterized protein (TIGR02145 family)
MKPFRIINLINISILSLTLFSCNNTEKNIEESSVEIGKQTWMVHNLDVETFMNGDSILLVKNYKDWMKACKNHVPACCQYKFFDGFGYTYTQVAGTVVKQVKYGKLYNEYAIKDPRGLAPKGWKIPSINDWIELLNYYKFSYEKSAIDTTAIIGGSVSNFTIWSKNQNIPDYIGFSAVTSGGLNYLDCPNDDCPIFVGMNEYSQWWTNTENSEVFSLFKEKDRTSFVAGTYFHNEGYYVRCIK